ncbi:MAG: hypothetical protein WD314_13695 [Trueperaceae bacterium]
MLKLEHVALELFEYKVEEVRARREVRGGLASVWTLYHHLHKQAALLAPDERRRLELAERALRHVSGTAGGRPTVVTEFSDLVLGGAGEDLQAEPQTDPMLATATAPPIAAPPVPAAENGAVGAEQASLQNLAAKVWRHDLDRFIRKIAGGLRAERDRYTARLLYAVQRNLHLYCQTDEARGDTGLERFRVSEAMPAHDDPFLSVNDIDSLAELVRETVDCVLDLAASEGPYRLLGVASGAEFRTMRAVARAVAADPYAGRAGLLEQRGPNAQQLRVAMQELGKERLRDEERLSQRRQLEERLQQVLAFERNQRQLFHQDVARFEALVDAFFDRLARYLPQSVGASSGPPRLAGGVLFAINPALRIEAVDPHVPSVTARLKGPTRIRLAGLEVSVSGPGADQKLYLRGEEHSLAGELAVNFERKWLYAFTDGDYLHLKVEDEARSVVVRVAEAAAVLRVMSSPERDELLAVLRILADGSAGEMQELVRMALQSIAALTAKAPDRAAALEGFLRGGARAAKVSLSEGAVEGMRDSLQRALSVESSDLGAILEEVDLGEVSVHTLTGEPLALEVGTYGLTVRQYRVSGEGNQESLVVMLPGHAIGTFDEYLIEPLGDGLLICVKGEQELVVGYLRSRADAVETSTGA